MSIADESREAAEFRHWQAEIERRDEAALRELDAMIRQWEEEDRVIDAKLTAAERDLTILEIEVGMQEAVVGNLAARMRRRRDDLP